MAAAAPAPVIRVEDPARHHRPVGVEPLPGDFEPELVETAEQDQVRAIEARRGSVVHVEVFQMGGVRTSTSGDLGAYLVTDAPAHLYTLICEEIP